MLTHRFINELTSLERDKIFCGQDIVGSQRVLIIGTFNPNNEAFPDPTNNAQWFYGRTLKNKFWYYFPKALTNQSLHPTTGHTGRVESWKEYCVHNGVVIIDMIKSIDHQEILTSQKDGELERRILPDLSNVQYFQVEQAFRNTTFDKVLYSLAWSDKRNLPNMVRIRDLINRQLIIQHTINNINQIKYCKAPWRNDALLSWQTALN
jgi:hypothetical protein